MPLILNIDTSQNGMYISLCKKGICIAYKIYAQNTNQIQHLNTLVQDLLLENNFTFKNLNAISILTGPGSYTGLRVGMASAKGFSFALDIPIIAIENLYLLAYNYYINNKKETSIITPLYAPMLGEIIYTKYSVNNKQLNNTQNTIHIKQDAFVPNNAEIIIADVENQFSFLDNKIIKIKVDKNSINEIAYNFYTQNNFADINTLSPNYIKEAFIQNAK